MQSPVRSFQDLEPEGFTRDNDLWLLGYEQDRAALAFRVLKRLLEGGHIDLAERRSGRMPSRYRKPVSAAGPPAV